MVPVLFDSYWHSEEAVPLQLHLKMHWAPDERIIDTFKQHNDKFPYHRNQTLTPSQDKVSAVMLHNGIFHDIGNSALWDPNDLFFSLCVILAADKIEKHVMGALKFFSP